MGLRTPPSSLRKPHVSDTTPNRAFLRGFPATHFLDFGLCRRSRILVAILALCLCIQKFHSRQPGFEHEVGPHRTRKFRLLGRRNSGPSAGAAAYSGLSPSASNCRLHSVGGSRSRSTPMPRGKRPSIAALTRLGARKASDMVILTCRTLHFSRVQSSAIVVIRPETTSSSHRRPRAIALTRRARRSNCSGRTSLRDALCGSRIWRDLLEGGFCQGIESDRSSGESDGSSAFSDLSRTTSLSSYTTIPATSCATAPRSPESTLLVVDLSCLAARCFFRSFTTTASMSAAGTRATDPADAVFASPCRKGVDT